jgi:hypothetical protein
LGNPEGLSAPIADLRKRPARLSTSSGSADQAILRKRKRQPQSNTAREDGEEGTRTEDTPDGLVPAQSWSPPVSSPIHFIELFAGEGGLTAAFIAKGIACEPPNDLQTGGTDFSSRIEIAKLKKILQRLRSEGKRLVIHLAIPCCTFSRARDRSKKTRLRSTAYPWGLPALSPEARELVTEHNAIAHEGWAFAIWAAKALDAVCCLENPSGSYIWPFFESLQTKGEVVFQDAVVSQCLYGAPYRKDTRFRLWNAPATGLQDQCTHSENGHTCGRDKHMIL